MTQTIDISDSAVQKQLKRLARTKEGRRVIGSILSSAPVPGRRKPGRKVGHSGSVITPCPAGCGQNFNFTQMTRHLPGCERNQGDNRITLAEWRIKHRERRQRVRSRLETVLAKLTPEERTLLMSEARAS